MAMMKTRLLADVDGIVVDHDCDNNIDGRCRLDDDEMVHVLLDLLHSLDPIVVNRAAAVAAYCMDPF